jgi:hypothetical protein
MNRAQQRCVVLHHGQFQAAAMQSIRHLQADVSPAHDHGMARLLLDQKALKPQSIPHPAQAEHTRFIGAIELRPPCSGSGGQDQAVVEDVLTLVGFNGLARGVHSHGSGVGLNLETRAFQLRQAAMGQLLG